MSLEISIVLTSIVSKAKNANLLTVMKPLRDPFMIVERVESVCLFTNFLLRYKSTQKQQKQTKRASSLLKKGVHLLADKQLFVNVPFQSMGRIVCGQKVEETIGDVYCPACRNEKCVDLSTNRTSSFYDCRKNKACSHVLNIHFKEQKLTNIMFGGDGTPCFAKKTSRNYKNEKPFPF